jgi:hypothetical protein
MKRSEALKIIDEQYSKYVDDLVRLDMDDEKVLKSFIRLDERVLSALESAGMLPPANEESIKIEEGKDGELFIPIWKWVNE